MILLLISLAMASASTSGTDGSNNRLHPFAFFLYDIQSRHDTIVTSGHEVASRYERECQTGFCCPKDARCCGRWFCCDNDGEIVGWYCNVPIVGWLNI